MGKDKKTGGRGIVVSDTCDVTIDKFESEGCDTAIEANDSAKLRIGESKITGYIKTNDLIEAIKKPVAGRVKVWHVIGTLILAPLLVLILHSEYEIFRESTSQEQSQTPPPPAAIDNSQ